MKTPSYALAWLAIGFVLGGKPWSAWSMPTAQNEPEASPLYRAEVKRAYADMSARDLRFTQLPASGADFVLTSDEVVVVEGSVWHRQSLGGKSTGKGLDPHGTKFGPVPMETLDSPSCGRTCASYPTCSGSSTCTPEATCNGTCTFFPTCTGSGQATCSWSCDTSPTCSKSPTCAGYNTCGYTAPTCSGFMTCAGWGPTCSGATCSTTCGGNSTCITTCNVANCPAPQISNILVSNNVPMAGQCWVQIGFYAAGSVRYTVQYCTNLDGLSWSNVFSKLGDGTATTFVHTNNAPRAYYRLLMQNS